MSYNSCQVDMLALTTPMTQSPTSKGPSSRFLSSHKGSSIQMERPHYSITTSKFSAPPHLHSGLRVSGQGLRDHPHPRQRILLLEGHNTLKESKDFLEREVGIQRTENLESH